jgi:hypothetical protein
MTTTSEPVALPDIQIPADEAMRVPELPKRPRIDLFIVSFVILFFELAAIRWFGSTVLDRLRGIADELGERVAQQRFRVIVDDLPTMVTLMTPDGEFADGNRYMLEYFGAPLEELKRRPTTYSFHPDDRPGVDARWRESIESGRPYDYEARLRRADGTYRWFHTRGFPLRDAEGRIVLWYLLQTDVDDRKRAEDALRARERNLKLIIDTIPALAWSASTDGRAEFFNQHYLDFVGISAEEARGWGWTAAVHPDDLNVLAAAWRRILESEAPGEAVARLRRHDGRYRWFLFRTNPLRDESGTIVKWYGVNTDIEDRKQAEEALRELQATMSRAVEVATIGELAASIAHEVNQPLSGIITNAGTCLRMLAADPPNIDGARETAKRAIRDGNRASEVVVRLRALFAKEDFTLESVDLNEAAREVVALSLRHLQKNGVVLRSDLADDLPLITGDRVQLQQVILNLLRNASDAMSDVHDRPRQLVVRTARDGANVRLIVQDAGVGLDPEHVGKLFKPFHTTKADGMGVGLSISRSIIARHQGRLWAEPNDGPGATFAFAIPIAADAPGRA